MFINNFLICLTGLPASGKSTFACALKSIILHEQDKFKVKIIDPDIIRSAITKDSFNPEIEQVVRNTNLKKIEKNLKQNKIVISDDINYYASMRHKLKEIALELDIPFFIIYISTPLEICLKWNEKRGNPIPNEVILKIAKKFDMFEKYDWESPDLIIDLSKIDNLNQEIRKFLTYVKSRFKNRVNRREMKKESKSTIKEYNEMLESVSRAIVGDFLKKPKFKGKKNEMLNLRKRFVQDNLDKKITEKEIKQEFLKFLEKTLNISII